MQTPFRDKHHRQWARGVLTIMGKVFQLTDNNPRRSSRGLRRVANLESKIVELDLFYHQLYNLL